MNNKFGTGSMRCTIAVTGTAGIFAACKNDNMLGENTNVLPRQHVAAAAVRPVWLCQTGRSEYYYSCILMQLQRSLKYN